MAPYFPKISIGRGEMIVSRAAMKYLNKGNTSGDDERKVELYPPLDWWPTNATEGFSGSFLEAFAGSIFSRIGVKDGIREGEEPGALDMDESLAENSAPPAPGFLSLNYTVIDEFDEADGKFSDRIGNVALIDCHYIAEVLPQADFCGYAPEIKGVLKDQVGPYVGSGQHMKDYIAAAGNELVNALSLDANITSQAPLQTSM